MTWTGIMPAWWRRGSTFSTNPRTNPTGGTAYLKIRAATALPSCNPPRPKNRSENYARPRRVVAKNSRVPGVPPVVQGLHGGGHWGLAGGNRQAGLPRGLGRGDHLVEPVLPVPAGGPRV